MARKSEKKKYDFIVHQFHHSVAFGDAITNQMVFIQDSLKKIGIRGEIFSAHAKSLPASSIKSFSTKKALRSDLLLVHHSSGNPLLSKVLSVDVPKALVYHNITPETFYRHDRYIQRLLRLGRNQLELFKDNIIATLADSEFNARELEGLGLPPSEIFPLFDLSSLPKPNRTSSVDSSIITLLFVGKLAPHKNQDLLIRVLYCLEKISTQKYRLVLVGSKDPVYQQYLSLLAKVLGLESSVVFKGKISSDELKSHYQSADAFVSLSLHEGFSIPLIEAMAASMPVFALATSVITETLGGAGVELYSENPLQIAAVIDTVLEKQKKPRRNNSYFSLILKSQNERLKTLKKSQSAKKVQEICLNLLEKLQPKARATEIP